MPTFPAVERLPYAALRPLIQSGDILLCSGSAIFSKLIQHATGSVWSHVAFVLRMESLDRVVVLESVESIGSRVVPLSQYVRDYNGSGDGYHGRIFLCRHAQWSGQTAETLQHFSQGAIDLFGYPYDKEQILQIAMRITAKKLGMSPKPPAQNRAFICSEYVDVCLRSIGITVPFDPRGFIAPADYAKCPDITIMAEIAVEHGP